MARMQRVCSCIHSPYCQTPHDYDLGSRGEGCSHQALYDEYSIFDNLAKEIEDMNKGIHALWHSHNNRFDFRNFADTGLRVIPHRDEGGHFTGFTFINCNIVAALAQNTVPIMCVDGGHTKAPEMPGWSLLIAASMNGNGRLVAMGYMLCPSENNLNVTSFMQHMRETFPDKFNPDTSSYPVRLGACHSCSHNCHIQWHTFT